MVRYGLVKFDVLEIVVLQECKGAEILHFTALDACYFTRVQKVKC